MYPILYGLFYLISLLPFRLLYGLSDFCYLFIYKIFGYRKEVVFDNLRRSFPEKSENEIARISSAYYRNLCDMIFETLKLLSISPKQLRKRFVCDLQFLHIMNQQNKKCQIHLGHQFNWEWANLYLQLEVQQPFLVVYMPLSNKAMDKLFKKIRGRFGGVMIPANDVAHAMQPWHNKAYVSVLVADQNPGNARRALWFSFLNQMTAFYKGPEITARRYNAPVFFGEIRKIKRGLYHASMSPIAAQPDLLPAGKITAEFVRRLEAEIRNYPSNWVWSHRRWKHTFHPNYETLTDSHP